MRLGRYVCNCQFLPQWHCISKVSLKCARNCSKGVCLKIFLDGWPIHNQLSALPNFPPYTSNPVSNLNKAFLFLQSIFVFYPQVSATTSTVELVDDMEPLDDVRLHHIIVSDIKWSQQERIRRATRVRTCNYVKIKTGQNFPPVLKIVTHTAQAA